LLVSKKVAPVGANNHHKKPTVAELVASVHEGGAILRGEQAAARIFTIQPPEIKDIRECFGRTQEQFAALLGISVRTLRNWEQGRPRVRKALL